MFPGVFLEKMRGKTTEDFSLTEEFLVVDL
jgi:hypothetical protein